jgi:patatin-like phospholipase/acyl hydrolase
MKRILALDGGGIRGVFTLQILARIEKLFREEQGDQDMVLRDVFDLIAGTSTGAIIGTFLAWGLPVKEIEKLYIDHSREMFTKLGLLGQLTKAKFDAEPITKFFRERFLDKDTGEPALLGTKHLEKKLLLIVMRNGSTGGSWPVTNNPKAKYCNRKLNDGTPNPECNLDFPLWRLLRASTAAPWYFPPEEIKIGSDTHLFMDGGMTPYNNPALIAMLTATLPQYQVGWPATRDQLHLISVGTGLVRARMPAKSARDVKRLEHVKYIAPALIGAAAWEQDLLCRVLGDCVHGEVLDSEVGALETPALLSSKEQKFTYARYDHPLDERDPRINRLPGRQIELDDIKQVSLLQDLGEEYAERHVDKSHFHPRTENFKPCKCSVTV